MDSSWWWKWLWKLNYPLKSKLYCWFLFSGKVLTWDILCRRGREGPGRCYLCKLESETNDHIGFDDQENTIWNSYVTLLTTIHAKITTEDDKLIWSLSKTGKYTPKAGYFHLILDRNEMESSWWWKWLWKLTCPLK